MRTRRAIVRAAAQLWTERGYDETTIEEICAAAGVGRSTYYLYFDSKERLLIELSIATAGGVAADVDAAPRHRHRRRPAAHLHRRASSDGWRACRGASLPS